VESFVSYKYEFPVTGIDLLATETALSAKLTALVSPGIEPGYIIFPSHKNSV
jgi:hypothetical protein